MSTQDSSGLGLIKAAIERAQNEKSLFNGALKRLVNSTEPELQNFLAREKVVQLISGGQHILIDPLDGKTTIANSQGVFRRVDLDLQNWNFNQPAQPTTMTPIDVHEVIGPANYAKMFASVALDFDKLVLSQAQIVKFCEKHSDWLGEWITLFLTREFSCADKDQRTLVLSPGEYAIVGVWDNKEPSINKAGFSWTNSETKKDKKSGIHIVVPKQVP